MRKQEKLWWLLIELQEQLDAVKTSKNSGESQQLNLNVIKFITDPENSATYLADISIDLSSLNITRKIRLKNLVRPIDTIYDFHLLFVTDYFKDRPAIHMIDISSDITVLAESLVDKNLAFPFGICKSGDRKLYVSDLMNHCVFELNIDTKEFLPADGVIGESGQHDGSMDKLNSPSGTASRGNSIYIAEHTCDIQGALCVSHLLQGLEKFQSIWHRISRVWNAFKERVEQNHSDENENIKVKFLSEALLDLDDPSQDLKEMVQQISTLHQSHGLYIYHMAL